MARELYSAGFVDVLAADRVRGPMSLSKTGTPQAAGEVLARLGSDTERTPGFGLDQLGRLMERVVLSSGVPTALIVEFASRLAARSDSLSPDEHAFFSRAQLVSCTAKARPIGPDGRPYYNSVIWIVDKEGDLPDWLLLGNPKIRHIPVAKPDNLARRASSPASFGRSRWEFLPVTRRKKSRVRICG